MTKKPFNMPPILLQNGVSSKLLLGIFIPLSFVFGILFSSSCLNISAGGEAANMQASLISPTELERVETQEVELLAVEEDPQEDESFVEAEVEDPNAEEAEAMAEEVAEEAPAEEDAPKKGIEAEIEAILAKQDVPSKPMPFVAAVYLQATGYPIPTTIEEIKMMRDQLTELDPEATVTWGMDLLYVQDETNRDSINYVMELVDEYGDEIGIGSGFPNNHYDTEEFARVMWEWVYFFRYNAFPDKHIHEEADPVAILNSIPEAYRPKSFVTYAINHQQADWVKQNFGIKNFMGWTATQYFVDQLSGSGSPLMPYWSHKDNPMVPAQSVETSSDSIFLNTITVDPIGSKYTQDASRWTIHPADPYISGANPQIHTIKEYLNNPYRSRNTMDYLSLFIDINWMYRDANLKNSWDATIENWPQKNTHPIDVMSISDFAEAWEAEAGQNNDTAEFTLLFRGSGDEILVPNENHVKSYVSEADLQYLWTETKTERIILQKSDNELAWTIIDFTDYSGEVPAMRYTSEGKYDDVSFVTGRNYKLSPTFKLEEAQLTRIKQRMEALEFEDPVLYQ